MTLPTCTLCLPDDIFRAKDRKDVPDGSQTWLVGWNPRGFVVCVAAVITAPTVEDVKAQLDEMAEAEELPRGLRVLGRLAPTAQTQYTIQEDDGSRVMRQKADIWLELDRFGPTLLEMLCCGYKYPPQLHVIWHDGNHDNFRTAPHPMTILEKIGLNGLRRLDAGMKPTLATDALGPLDGPILLPHCQQLYKKAALQTTPRDKEQKSGSQEQSTPNNSTATPPERGSATPPQPSLLHRVSHESIDSASTPLPNESFESQNDSLTATPAKLGRARSTSPQATAAASACKHFTKENCPPSIEGSSASDTTEFASVLHCINAGAKIRRYLAPGGAAASAARRSPLVEEGRPLVSRPVLLLCSIASWLLRGTLFLMQGLARVSYTARLSEGRTREALNFLGLLSGKSPSCGLHPVLPHLWAGTPALQKKICLQNFIIRTAVDILLGICMSFVLAQFRPSIFTWLNEFGYYGLYEMHMGYVEWFLGWPGGFKLNDSLNVLLGYICTLTLNGWQTLASYLQSFLGTTTLLEVAYMTAQAAGFFGLSTFFCVVADATNLSTLHVRNLAHVFALVYRTFLSVLGSLQLQFRGLRYNPLRRRCDDGEFQVDEVLLGTLVGTLMTFIFPTVAMYYFYLTWVRTIVWVVQEGMQALALLSLRLPFGYLIAWFLYRGQLTHGVSIGRPEIEQVADKRGEEIEPKSPMSPTGSRKQFPPSPAIGMRLDTKPMPLGPVFVEFQTVLSIVAAALRPRRLVNFVIHARHKPTLDPKGQLWPHLAASYEAPIVVTPIQVFKPKD